MPLIQGNRVQELVNAPGSVAPQTTLTTVSEIQEAIRRNTQGGNYGVYCKVKEETQRVIGARTQKGVLKVQTFTDWITPDSVFVEG